MTEAIGNIKRHLEPSELIRREIAASTAGAIPFERFMELALYAPGRGYYRIAGREIGRRGDFFTSVSVGPLFGALLAARFLAWMLDAGMDCLQCVESGAHDGRLAEDILEAWCRANPSGRSQLEYWIIEPSGEQEVGQRQRLARFGDRVRWSRSLGELGGDGVQGVIFSNELLDAMPVRRLGWDASAREWFEWGVRTDGDAFAWTRLVRASERERTGLAEGLADAVLDLLPDGFTIETSPAAVAWWSQAARTLRRGWLITLDYGLVGGEQFRPERLQGTLRAYRHHQLSADVLASPGDQDLTAHVAFESLRATGEAAGLQTERLCAQEEFLVEAAALLEANPPPGFVWTLERRRQLLTLVHPEHLGRRFKVLVQKR